MIYYTDTAKGRGSRFEDLLSDRGHRPNIHINTHTTKYTYRVV